MRKHLMLTALLTLAAASPASAGTVGITQHGTLGYAADRGETNELAITLQERLTIQDGTVGTRDTLFVYAMPPCEHDSTPQPSPSLIDAYCPVAGVQRIAIALRDGNDIVSLGGLGPLNYPSTISAGTGNDRLRSSVLDDRLFGGPGDDTLDGGDGSDLLAGDSGNDTIVSQDGTRDRVICGPGLDRVSADQIDIVSASCEIINGVTR